MSNSHAVFTIFCFISQMRLSPEGRPGNPDDPVYITGFLVISVCDIAVWGGAENIISAARNIPASEPEISLRVAAVIISADPRVKVLYIGDIIKQVFVFHNRVRGTRRNYPAG